MTINYFQSPYRFFIIAALLIAFGMTQHSRNMQGFTPPSIGTLSGTIVDSLTGNPIEYASISIMNHRSKLIVTGGVTDDRGQFTIDKIPLGKYQVALEFIGYEKFIIPSVVLSPRKSIEQNIGIIRMIPSIIKMEGVTVSEDKPLFINTIDKKIFNVDQSKTSIGGTAEDVLGEIPSVDVDMDGKISLRGSENVTVLIDGRPSALTGSDRGAILSFIPASTIRSVEVITNPSAKYDPDGMAGIINIILKKNRLAGFNGNINTYGGMGEKYNLSGALNFRTGSWNIFGNYSWRKSKRVSEGYRYIETLLSDSIMVTEQESFGHRISLSHLLKAGADYIPDDKNTFSVSTTTRISASERYNRDDFLQDDLKFLNYSTNETDGSGRSIDMLLGYYRDFESPQRKFSIELNHSKSNDEDTSALLGFGEGFIDSLITDNNNDFTVNTIQSDYVHPLNEQSKYELGFKSVLRRMDRHYFQSNPVSGQMFFFSEDVHAVYGTFSRSLGEKFGIQLGLRLEQVETEIDTGKVLPNNYGSIFPSGHLQYEIREKQQVRASYSRRVNRPRSRQINPFPNRSSQNFIRKGNPYLKPEYIDSWEMSYSLQTKKGMISASIYYKAITDMIRYFRNDTSETTILTFVNLGDARSYGTELIITGRVTPWWKLTLSGTSFNTVVEKFSEEATQGSEEQLNSKSSGFFGRLSSTWTLPGEFELQYSSRFRMPMNVSQGIISSMVFADIALEKTFLDGKGSTILKISDLFNSRKFNIESKGFVATRRWSEGQVASLSINYRFGEMHDKKYNRRRGNYGSNGGMEMDGMGY